MGTKTTKEVGVSAEADKNSHVEVPIQEEYKTNNEAKTKHAVNMADNLVPIINLVYNRALQKTRFSSNLQKEDTTQKYADRQT